MLFFFDWVGVLPEFFLGIMVLIYFLYRIESGECPELGIEVQLIEVWLAILLLWNTGWTTESGWSSYFLKNFFVDSWSFFWKMVLIFFIIFYFFLLKKEKVSFEYTSLILLFQFGLFLLLSASHFLVFYLSLELSSFILYLLVGSQRESLFSTEAGLKYFVLGSFASIFLLLGIVLVYQCTGSLSFLDVSLWGSSFSLVVALCFFFFGICFKLGGAPFHFWIPDVYQGSRWSVLYWLVVVSKIGILGFFLRFFYTVAVSDFLSYSLIFSWVGFLSLLIGTFGAIAQTNLKRLVGYSGISHMGFLFLGVSSGTGFGLLASVSYFLIYLSLNSSWLWILWLKGLEKLEELKGFVSLVGVFLVVTMFSIAGVPPLSGFFMKLYLLMSLVQVENWLVAVGLVCFSVLSAFYYLRLVRLIFFQGEKRGFLEEQSFGSGYWWLVILGYFSCFFGPLQKYGYGSLIECSVG